MALGLQDLAAYLAANQDLDPASAALSDLGGIGGNVFLGPLGGLLGGLAGSFLPDIIGMFSGRPKMEATSDIAKAASESDPVLALLGLGAKGLSGTKTPISSPSAGPEFGPYFNAARELEDIARWGPGGATDPKLQALDATTLKTALTELGNRGNQHPTLDALRSTWNEYTKNTPDWQKQASKLIPSGSWGLISKLINPGGGGTNPDGSGTPSGSNLGSSALNALAAGTSLLPGLNAAGAIVNPPPQPPKLPLWTPPTRPTQATPTLPTVGHPTIAPPQQQNNPGIAELIQLLMAQKGQGALLGG